MRMRTFHQHNETAEMSATIDTITIKMGISVRTRGGPMNPEETRMYGNVLAYHIAKWENIELPKNVRKHHLAYAAALTMMMCRAGDGYI